MGITDYSRFNAIHNPKLIVYPKLPEWAREGSSFQAAGRLRRASGHNEYQDLISFVYCRTCGGWVPGPASETDFAQATPMGVIPKRPAGTAYYCPRCGIELTFVER